MASRQLNVIAWRRLRQRQKFLIADRERLMQQLVCYRSDRRHTQRHRDDVDERPSAADPNRMTESSCGLDRSRFVVALRSGAPQHLVDELIAVTFGQGRITQQ